MGIESFIKEKLEPVYRAHYALWVYWWPLWRGIYSGRNIQRKWKQFDMVKEGQSLLDYGCGTGTFTLPAARIVGMRGRVHALDCLPRQLGIVEKKSKKEGLTNIQTILADTQIDLPDDSIDIVWMCDVFHEIEQKRAVLEELYRVLRREGSLAMYDGMKDKVLDYTEGLFSLTMREGKFLKFARV